MDHLTPNNQSLHQLDQANYLPTFNRYPITLSKGAGSRVWDIEGKSYIDTVGGIAVNNIGHCHPRHVAAICEQAGKLMHICNAYLSEPQAMLAQKLKDLSGMDRVFFTNSGAESVEGAIKIARKYAHSIGRGGDIISFDGSFHGRTLATIAAGRKKYQRGFEPIPDGFHRIPFDDIEAVKAVITKQVGGILIEPIQGEGGIRPASPEYLKELRALCTEHDIVLILDEVQTGFGRTGKMFAKELFDIQPDVMALAKGMGGGYPTGAVLSSEKVGCAMDKGDHGTTFGGNPLACAAALAVIEIIEDEKLVARAAEMEIWLREEIDALNEPKIKEVRGHGLMLGLQFEFQTRPLAQKMLQKGILANACAGDVIRFVPALNISKEEFKIVLETLKECLQMVPEAV